MTERPIKLLFQKFLDGACTDEEITLLLDYIRNADNPDDIPGVEEVRAMFPEATRMDSQAAERIFNDIMLRHADPGRPIRRLNGLRTFIRSSRAMAASIALLFTVTVAGYFLFWPQRVAYTTPYGRVDTLRLDDGSVITLNANTTVSISKTFATARRREVWISGEAFFQVAHDAEKPFVVHTERGMDIEVLGTAFNVNARTHEATVVLSQGSVAATLGKQVHRLKPGEMIQLPANAKAMTVTPTDTLYYASWRHHLLAFKDETLRHVANTIHDRYGYELLFADAATEQLRFTGSVPADDLDMALNMIALAFELAIEKTGNELHLKKRNTSNN